LEAVIERSRFGFLPLSLAARYGMNRLVDSRNCYELIQSGFLIPWYKLRQERQKDIETERDVHDG
jgi:hypothetical protein